MDIQKRFIRQLDILRGTTLLYGNGYAEIERDQAGNIVGLWPISSDRISPRKREDGKLFYHISNRASQDSFIPADDVFHTYNRSFDGVAGCSMIEHVRQRIGTRAHPVADLCRRAVTAALKHWPKC